MRKSKDTKKFSQNIRLLWYAAALVGLLLFCFVPLSLEDGTEAEEQSAALKVAPAGLETEEGFCAEAEVLPVFLMQGDCGSDVFLLQTQLQALGYEVGDCSGVYTQQTASAVRQFQLDSGFVGDGICSAAVSHAISYLSGNAEEIGALLSDEEICCILQELGYWLPVPDAAEEDILQGDRYRNALILFQRTHGLCGSGIADYATVCALGIAGGRMLSQADDAAAEAAQFDLRCRLLSEALAEYVLCYPAAYDLYTLTACAAVLCSRTADERFPGSFDAVCHAGLLSDSERQSSSVSDSKWKQEIMRRSRDLLLIRAAEDALRAHLSEEVHGNAAHGALYVCPADQMPQEAAVICLHTGKFVFFR